jgi:hypothetical protein
MLACCGGTGRSSDFGDGGVWLRLSPSSWGLNGSWWQNDDDGPVIDALKQPEQMAGFADLILDTKRITDTLYRWGLDTLRKEQLIDAVCKKI